MAGPAFDDDDGPNASPPPVTIFGWDLYAIGFIAIAGGAILGAIFWIFFTNWPLHMTCSPRRSGYADCGWFDRQGRQVSAPTGR